MSHKTELKVNVDNQEALEQALEEMGFKVRKGKHTLNAWDWKMDCDLSILKDEKQLNIGFKKQEDGTFSVEADWWGTGINEKDFRDDLNQFHSKHKVSNWLKNNKYKVAYAEEEDGCLVVTGTRWAS